MTSYNWYTIMKYLIPITIILVSLFSCRSQSDSARHITVPLTRSDYISYVETTGELDAVRSHIITSPRISYTAKVSWLLPEGSRVGKDELVVRLEMDEVQNQYLTALDQLEIAKADAENKEAELNLQQLLYEAQYLNSQASAQAAQLQLAKLEFEPLKTREIKKLEIERYEIDAEQARLKMEALKKIQNEERKHMNLIIRQVQNRVEKLQENLKLLTIKSPVAGIVIYEENWITDEKLILGDQIYPGMPLVKIPDMSVMQVKLQLGESEAQRVKKGQKAHVTVPNLNNLVLPGHVENVDNMARQVRRQFKIRKVEVIVTIDSTVQALTPGLSALCRIETGFMENVVSIPLDCIFEKDSVKFVYVDKGKKFIPFPVDIISQDDDYAIIEGDFSGDEQLSLTTPPASKISWPKTLTKPYRNNSRKPGLQSPDSTTSDNRTPLVFAPGMDSN